MFAHFCTRLFLIPLKIHNRVIFILILVIRMMIAIIVISRQARQNLAFPLLEPVRALLCALVVEHGPCSYFYGRCSASLATWRPGAPLGILASNGLRCGHRCRTGYWIISAIMIIIVPRLWFAVRDVASFQLPQFSRTCSASVLRSSLNGKCEQLEIN